MNPSATDDIARPALSRAAAISVAAGWLTFIAAFFVAPDRHELRLVFNWLVLLPVAASLPWIVPSPRIPRLATGAVFACLCWFCLSTAWGPSAGIAFPVHEAANLFLIAGLLLATVSVVRHARWLVRDLDAVIATLGCIVAMISLAMHYLATLHQGTPPHLIRLAGPGILRNELVLASILGVSLLLAAVRYYRSPSAGASAIWLAACVPLLVAMLGTLSRGPLLALLAALPLVALSSRAQARRHLAPLACLAVAAGIAASMPDFLDHAAQRGFDPSHRDQIWRAVIEETADDWIIGQGLRAERQVDIGGLAFPHEHSHFLSVFRHSGAVGAGLFALAFLALIREAARLPLWERSAFLPWLVYGFGCQLTNGTFPLSRPNYEWLLLWVPAACCLALRQSRLQPA